MPNPPCTLVKRWILRDYCPANGQCPPGSTCTTTMWRPYGPWGIFGKQAAACACVGAPVIGKPAGLEIPGGSESPGPKPK